MSSPDRLRHWLRAAEAAALLLLARWLVASVRFERWRSTLGRIEARPESAGEIDVAAIRRVRAGLYRALERLPGEFKCLPQAMALQWMLRRRGIASVLTIAALPRSDRVRLESLHAWVSAGGEILIGQSDQPHVPVLHLTTQGEGRATVR